MSILKLNMLELSKELVAKKVSPSEVVAEYIKVSEKSDELNIYITKTFDSAKQQALEADKRWSNGTQKSNFDGIAIGIKDIFLTQNERTTNGSKFLDNFIAPIESTVTQNLKNAGFISLGKLNMDEFAMGSANITSAYGAVISPWSSNENPNLVPGGSSGGSAAAVSSYSVLAATGTDTGGSIRQPASFSGIVGLKPTYGTCSRYGIIAFASSLDQAGPMTRTVADNAAMLQVMSGYDAKDSSMVKRDTINYSEKIGKSIKGLKVGLPKEYTSDKMPKLITTYWQKVAEILKSEGAEIVEVSLPHTKYALPIYYITASFEAASNLSRFDGIRYGMRAEGETLEDIYINSRTQGWGEEVKRRILVGNYNLLTENFKNVEQSAKVRRLLSEDFINIFKSVDILLTPTATSEAFSIENSPTNPIEMYLNDIFTVTANLAGVPAMSLPVGLGDKGLPIGMQLIGKHFDEATIYQVASVIEASVKFNAVSNFIVKNKLV